MIKRKEKRFKLLVLLDNLTPDHELLFDFELVNLFSRYSINTERNTTEKCVLVSLHPFCERYTETKFRYNSCGKLHCPHTIFVQTKIRQLGR